MTDAKLEALEAAAKAATPGLWEINTFDEKIFRKDEKGTTLIVVNFDCYGVLNEKDFNYIAAANPAVILELIAELQQARAERDYLAEHRPVR